MKKSFLKTFIVLGLFSIFLCGGFEIVGAQNQIPSNLNHPTYSDVVGNRQLDPKKPAVLNNTWVENGTSYKGSTYFYTDGSKLQLKWTTSQTQERGKTYISASTPLANLVDSKGNKVVGANGKIVQDTQILAPGSVGERDKAAKVVTNQENKRVAPTSSVCGTTEFGCAIREVFAEVLLAGVGFVAWIISFTGTVFDKAIAVTTTYPTWGDSIYGAWKIIRDFTNIILVFSLLYLGIRTIYDGQGFAEKKTLAGIILAAVLINFSFFFVKDVAFNLSNTIGLQVLENVKSPTNSSYSAGFMEIIKPQKILAGQQTAAIRGGWPQTFSYAGQLLLFAAITLSLGFIFLGTALILIYRFIIFIILIIASPIGFVSTQIPWLKQYGTQWSTQLKQQVIFFPAFTLTLYIVLYITTGLATTLPQNLVSGGGNNSVIFDFIFKFILIMGFMIGLMILPSKMGAAGAGFMDKAGKGLTQRIRNIPKRSGQVALGGAARTGRTFVGGGIGGGLVDGNSKFSKSLKNIAADPNSKWGGVARATLRRGEALKNSTFDVRNTKVGAKLGMGKGIESWGKLVEGKKKALEDRKKKEEKLFGFDKLSKDNKKAVATAEAERDFQAEKVNKEQEKVKKAQEQFNNKKITEAERDRAIARHQEEQKELEKLELKVGKAKNLGDSKYLELMKKRTNRWYKAGFNVAQKEAFGKVEKDLEKKWKEEGKAKQQKKKDKDTKTPPAPATPAPTGTAATYDA